MLLLGQSGVEQMVISLKRLDLGCEALDLSVQVLHGFGRNRGGQTRRRPIGHLDRLRTGRAAGIVGTGSIRGLSFDQGEVFRMSSLEVAAAVLEYGILSILTASPDGIGIVARRLR